MDEETAIIDRNTRNEKIKNFFINNKKRLITFLLILIIILISFFGFREYKDTKKIQISENYNSIIIDYSNGNLDSIKDRLKMIIAEKDPTYSPLSLYFIIDNNLSENKTEVNSLFDILINKTSLNEEIKNLIIYKKALYNADDISETEIIDILKPLINSKSVWKSHALYLLAEYFFSKNEKQKAKDFFQQIISLENANSDIQIKAQKRLNRDISD
tara:strand:+ start:438 stop:1082 length:645 start_codon:yes stop_codon:yes gene_type:complete